MPSETSLCETSNSQSQKKIDSTQKNPDIGASQYNVQSRSGTRKSKNKGKYPQQILQTFAPNWQEVIRKKVYYPFD